MAMRHPKSTVLSGALSALVVMTVGETEAFAVSQQLSGGLWIQVWSN
jgi:putative Ca2+/H+ antiporter (TMEM165/GDT1 family)